MKLFATALLITCCASAAFAQTVQMNQVAIGQDQLLLIQATQKAAEYDFPAAEQLYSQAIAANGNNVQAYLQRGITRREMKNDSGMQADARQAIAMADMQLQKNPNNANAYYARGSAYRLLRDYPRATADIRQALSISPQNSGWQQDLQAIDLEAKMQ